MLFEEYLTGDILLGHMNCSGSEHALLDCQFSVSDSGSSRITPTECEDHAGVICEGIDLSAFIQHILYGQEFDYWATGIYM